MQRVAAALDVLVGRLAALCATPQQVGRQTADAGGSALLVRRPASTRTPPAGDCGQVEGAPNLAQGPSEHDAGPQHVRLENLVPRLATSGVSTQRVVRKGPRQCAGRRIDLIISDQPHLRSAH
jgi:hypothetical protein